MYSNFNKPNLVKSMMPFSFDESPLNIQELLKFRDMFNGDLNASLMDIKIAWKNHYAWRPDFLKNTKRLFSTRKSYISDPVNFASLLQVGLELPTVKKVINHVIQITSEKIEFDEHLHYDAALEYLKELDQLKSVALNKTKKMKDNTKFIDALDKIIVKIRNNINNVYPKRPFVKENLPIIIE